MAVTFLTNEDRVELEQMISEMADSSSDSGQNVDLTGYAKEAWVQQGFQPKGNYLTKAPVESVNGKTGEVQLDAAAVGARSADWMPTANEVGAHPNTWAPTAEQVGADPKGTAAGAVSAHNTNNSAHNDIRQELAAINARLTAFFNSDNQTLDELSEIVAYITSNKSLIDAITTSKVSVADIVNNLTTNVANKPLSAAQGVAIKALIDGLSTGKLDASKLTEAINTALTQAKASGEFDGAQGKPGKDGTNGTSVTVKSVSESTEDGGSNVVTFSDGTTLTVRNGNKGSDGAVTATAEPADDDIPKVFLTGDEFGNMTADKNEVNMELEYRSMSKQFHAYILIKYQGRSSLSKPKKNFTIKMYSDEARASKQKMAFKDWEHKTHKYVLKANFIDHTHSRNIVGATLWSEVVATRSDYATLPEELRNSPRNGAIDGFPVKLYVNGTYQGIYTWNIGKDDWMWGMDEDNPNHVLLSNEGDQGNSVVNSGNFRKVWNGTDGSHWSIEVGTNSAALKTSLNNLITFVMNNNGAAFRSGIGTYLDVQSAIDYYIHQYVICNIDSLALNMLLATYNGTLWRCGAYDMDSTFGLWWTGEKFLPTNYKCPEDYQDKFSLLWERLEENFWPEIQARYAELRKTVYSVSNMFTHFERFTDTIGNDLYAEDLEAYPTIPQGSTCNIKQLRNFIRDRLVYCDSQITNGIPGTAVSLSATTLSIDTNSGGSATLSATKTPSNATDDIYWYSSDTAVATVENGVVRGVADGSCTIYARCGSGWASCAVTVTSAVVPDEPDEPETPAYTNLVPTSIDTDGNIYNGTGYMDGWRLNSSGVTKEQAGATHTGFMPFTFGSTIRVKGSTNGSPTNSGHYFTTYDGNFNKITAHASMGCDAMPYGEYETLEDGFDLATIYTGQHSADENAVYFRISAGACSGANLIVTVNEEIA